MTMEIKRVPISEINVWEKNPRNIKTKDFERLKKQIQELGIYKPLLCVQENGKYITLGGNMRLRALRELGHSAVDISIVKAKDEATKIKYALSDNDRAGEYDELQLAELTYPHIEEINLEDYKIDSDSAMSLKRVLDKYGPDAEKAPGEIPDPLKLTQEQLLDELKKYDNLLVEYSGGKDSTAALLWAQKGCEKIGKEFKAVFVETGAEFPDLSSYISRFCLDRNITLVRLFSRHSIVESFLKKKKWPDPIWRNCLHTFIVEPIEKYITTLEGKTIRIRGGRKTQRTGRSKSNTIQELKGERFIMNPFFPVEEKEYSVFIEKLRDVLWPGYKRGFIRTACWLCPFQTHEQWEALKLHYPLLWDEMKLLTKRIKYPRHKGESTVKRYDAYWNKGP